MSDLAALKAHMASLTTEERRTALETLSPAELLALDHSWELKARPDQLRPSGDYSILLALAGRGWGKTRFGSETVRAEVEAGRHANILVAGPTASAIRRDLVEGPSGLLATASPYCRPTYEPSSLRLRYDNGALIHLVTAEEPDRVRGINADMSWLDEFAAFPDPQGFLDMVLMANRLLGPKGHQPWALITTTPRPIPALKALVSPASIASGRVHVVRGKTMDNAANLAPAALGLLKERYEGSRLGRQELMGELLEDAEGALWNRDQLDECRVHVLPEMKRIVVAVDPAGSSNARSDETGIVACGLGRDGRGYVIADASGKYTPDGWARAAVNLYRSLMADRIVAEKNYGGEMCEATIRAVDGNVPVKMVHATRGKAVRAEPVGALFEQRRVSLIGYFPTLEDQLCTWEPGANESPDRLDAMVWAITDLMVDKGSTYDTSMDWVGYGDTGLTAGGHSDPHPLSDLLSLHGIF